MKPEVIVDSKGVRKLKVSFSLWPNDKDGNDKRPDKKGFDKETGVNSVSWKKVYNGIEFDAGFLEVPLSSLPASVADEFMTTPAPTFDDDPAIPF